MNGVTFGRFSTLMDFKFGDKLKVFDDFKKFSGLFE